VFTGLVEEVGRVSSIGKGEMLRLSISAGRVSDGVRAGDSVCVNGACLTVGEVDGGTLTFFAMPETLRRTALGDLAVGSPVNLERAVSAGSRFGGHIVQGHVDGVLGVRGARGGAPLLRAEGQHLRRRNKPDHRLDRGGHFYGLDTAPDPCEHEPGRARGGKQGKPRGRHYR
jgi:hypothetical protein